MPIFPSFFVNKTGGYEIEQSLRFDGSSRLSWTPSSSASRDAWTMSCWVKRARQDTEEQVIATDNSNELAFDNSTSNQVQFEQYYAKYDAYTVTTEGAYRDPSAWYHLVITWDSNNSTVDDRRILWINGERIPSPTDVLGWNNPVPSGKDSPFFDSGRTHYIGGQNTRYFQGYISEFHAVNGTALDATSFGEYDDNGVWRPVQYSGSHGSEGFYLKFDPSATNGIGHDHSGNGNNWTASGFTTSGTGTDVMNDTPTNNYCTLNPLFNNGTEGPGTLSEGNLRHTSDDNYAMCPGTMSLRNGKYYWEAQPISVYSSIVGIIRGTNTAENTYIGYDTNGNVFGFGYSSAGTIYGTSGTGTTVGGTLSTGEASFTTSDVIGIAVDIPNGTLDWYKNGTLVYSVTGINDDDWFPAVSSYSSRTWEVNFGQRAFAYTPPTGFKALNTSNLPAPDIADGSQYMNTVLWTGTGSSRTQTGYNFQPDLLWIMNRSNTGMNVRLHDVVRGDNGTVMYRLGTNHTNGQDTDTDVTGLTSTGFTIGNDGTDHPNVSGHSYVGWGWKAGQNSGSSNTDGTITSTVSASPSSGFSIGTFTGTGAVGSIGHGLGVAPKFILIKRTNVSGNSWAVYHDSLGVNKQLLLNSTNAASNDTNGFPSAPTSSVINVGTGAQMDTNQVGAHVFYAWSEVEGYSKFGSYTGNGSSDGPFVYCGFSVQWLLYKRSSAAEDWVIVDNSRDTYNVADAALRPNSSAAEFSNTEVLVDFASNGFKIRSSDAKSNGSGSTYIFAAFAENPFGGSGVSPATAR